MLPLAQISALNAEFRNFSADFSPQKMRNKCGVLGRGDPHAETRMRKKCGGNAEEMTECGKKCGMQSIGTRRFFSAFNAEITVSANAELFRIEFPQMRNSCGKVPHFVSACGTFAKNFRI